MSKNYFSGIADYGKALIFAVFFAFILKTTVVEAYGIPSSSMEDTLLIGDLMVSNKIIYGAKIPFTGIRLPAIRKPLPGDIITFKFPGDGMTDYVKRCVAIEGQIVEVRDKILYVDNVPMDEPEFSKHIDDKTYPAASNRRDNFGPFRVPPGTVFAMGDNRDNSHDSRFWGPVPLELIEGKVMFIQWSLAPDSTATTIDLADLSTIPASMWDNVTGFIGRIRWERTVKDVD
ncbi:MAG: signal peptidase I [FCB group bacterium]|nr:signal peptidase I [FCB group bacterium]